MLRTIELLFQQNYGWLCRLVGVDKIVLIFGNSDSGECSHPPPYSLYHTLDSIEESDPYCMVSSVLGNCVSLFRTVSHIQTIQLFTNE